jgi:hypothetical protein
MNPWLLFLIMTAATTLLFAVGGLGLGAVASGGPGALFIAGYLGAIGAFIAVVPGAMVMLARMKTTSQVFVEEEAR